jgi:hypothetical protein
MVIDIMVESYISGNATETLGADFCVVALSFEQINVC